MNATPSTKARFAKRLEKLLDERGLTQTDVAARSGIPRSDVNRIVNGHRPPRPDELVWLAEALAVDVGELIKDVELPERTAAFFTRWAERLLDVRAERDAAVAKQAAADAALGEAVAALEQERAAHRADVERVEAARRAEAERAATERSALVAERDAARRLEQSHRQAVAAANNRARVLETQNAALQAQVRERAGGSLLAGLIGAGIGALVATAGDDDDDA